MARRESIRTEREARHLNPIARLLGRGSVTGVALCSLATLFAWTTMAQADNGVGIGIKVGAQTIEDPIDSDKTTRARVEVEITSPVICDDHLDLAFSFGGSSLGSVDDDYSYTDSGTLFDEAYLDELSMFDVRLAARLYPFGYDQTLRPWVGAGLGYFWLFDRYEYEYAETFEDPGVPGLYHTYIDKEDGTDTLAHGFFPFVTAGLAVAVNDNLELLFEFQYDIDKEDEGVDLSGPIYMIGGRIRF